MTQLQTFLLVGGGSAYAPGLVDALIAQSDRHDLDTVRLYDIDPERLEIVARLCSKLAATRGEPFEVEATTDPVEAVRDVDVLLNSSRPGGFECRKIDETLPLELGVPGQETVGPGGFFFALRSVPAAMELAGHVARHAPDAIWLNYTNPTNIVTQALVDETDLDVIALCDQSDEDLEALVAALDLDDQTPYDFDCSGLNHATFYRDVRLGGEPLPDEVFRVDAPAYYDEEHKLRFRLSQRVAKKEGDVWPNSYLPYYWWPEKFVELARREGTRTEAILEGLDDYYAHFEEEASKEKPELRHYRGSHGFGDMAVDVIAALSSDEGDTVVLNVPNRGMSDDFDDATVIEAPVHVDEEGVERREAPPLPASGQGLLDALEVYQRKTAEAAVSGSASDLVDALAANPLIDGRPMAEKMLLRARDEYADHLPSSSG
ncbi:MAG: hypothetical protein ACOCV2_05085 [Persicimonas sp.]